MASYETVITIPRPIAETFAFISSFDNASLWDPRTYESTNVTEGPVRPGTRFVIRGSALKESTVRRLRIPIVLATMQLTYDMTEMDPPNRFVLEGENAIYRYSDHLGFLSDGENTLVTYGATLELRGPLRIFEGVLKRNFQRIGDDATAGLAEAVVRGT